MTPDPGHIGAVLGDPQTWNAYIYVGSDPINSIDPTGTVTDCPSGWWCDPDLIAFVFWIWGKGGTIQEPGPTAPPVGPPPVTPPPVTPPKEKTPPVVEDPVVTQCIPKSYLPMNARLGLRLMSMASQMNDVTYFFGAQASVAKTKIAGASYGVSGVWATDPQGNIAAVYSLSVSATLGSPGASVGLQIGAATYRSLYDGFPGNSFGSEVAGGAILNIGAGYLQNSAGLATYTNIGFSAGKNIDVNTHVLSNGVLIIPLCK